MSGRRLAVLATILSLGVPPVAVQAPKGLEGLRSLEDLKSLESLKGLEGLAGLEGLKGLKGLQGLRGLEALESLELLDPEGQQGQADSVYRAAREALNAGNYQGAVTLFQRVVQRYPGSPYAGDAIYWMAFISYRSGGTRNLETALRLLEQQRQSYPDAATRRDAEVLATRVRGELARLGNVEAAESVYVSAVPPAPPATPAPPAPAAAPAAPAPPARRGQGPECRDEDSELRAAALNALLQMDSERAIPILKQVMERRDPCSLELRRKAVFLLSQKRGPEVEDILLRAARDDPDREVRVRAVFWLSQVPGERAVAALDSILLRSTDHEVQEKAIFALSQHSSARAGEILRRFVERPDVSDDLKANAIFWLGQKHSPETLRYLRELYPRLATEELKERVIFSISQMGGADSQRWLMDVALNANESLELRKKALFWAGQSKSVPIADLVRLYDTMNDREMKDQLVFTYSQRREPEAVDKLMTIAERDSDAELRKKAIFWLGQSKDPRAAEFLLRLINR